MLFLLLAYAALVPATPVGNTTIQAGGVFPSSTSASAVVQTPAPWKDEFGPVAAGSFSFAIDPRYQIYPKTVAQLTIYTQSLLSSSAFIPHYFDISCSGKETDSQFFQSGTTLPYGLTIQAGHTCATGLANNNLDGLHVKYADQYLDVPSDKRCTLVQGSIVVDDQTVARQLVRCVVPILP